MKCIWLCRMICLNHSNTTWNFSLNYNLGFKLRVQVFIYTHIMLWRYLSIDKTWLTLEMSNKTWSSKKIKYQLMLFENYFKGKIKKIFPNYKINKLIEVPHIWTIHKYPSNFVLEIPELSSVFSSICFWQRNWLIINKIEWLEIYKRMNFVLWLSVIFSLIYKILDKCCFSFSCLTIFKCQGHKTMLVLYMLSFQTKLFY